tara:strand:- start:25762 stop:26832 length:1071 start_codon:yes stop_codon:yes gene_type:complete
MTSKISSTKLLISPEKTLLEALRLIDQNGLQTAFVASSDNKVLGVITDGDIRRALINEIGLNNRIDKFMNTDFLYLSEKDINRDIVELGVKRKLKVLPILDKELILIDLFELDAKSVQERNNSVVLMAGGKGTRLRPFTNQCPKPMLPINGKPMLESILLDCIDSGFKKFFISVNFMKEVIIDYFGDGTSWNVDISYLEEAEDKPLGTAGCLGMLPDGLTDPILLMNGDVRTHVKLDRVLDFHDDTSSGATLCAHEHLVDIPFGVLELEGNYLSQIVEKPSFTYLINAGIYVLPPESIRLIKVDERIDMPELLKRIRATKKQISVCPLQDYWIDVGRPEDYKKVQKDYATIEGITN